MRKYFSIVAALICLSITSNAAHIKGGFITYKYIGVGANGTNRYQVFVNVYMLGSSLPNQGQLPNNIFVTIYETGSTQVFKKENATINQQYFLAKLADDPCITGDQRENYYYVVIYELPFVDLPPSDNGYTLSYQRCCRISGVNNISGSGTVGNTWTVNIPGKVNGVNYNKNSSANFTINDTAVICADSYFEYPFVATDPDGDSLIYSLCDAYTGGSTQAPSPDPSRPPPYSSAPYAFPYSGFQPLGSRASINTTTGLISGIAPSFLDIGEYVLTVCISEVRNGVTIAQNRKELHIKVGNCRSAKPVLNPEYLSCDGFTLTFYNQSQNPLITSLHWSFGDNDTSGLMSPTHTYLDTGVYKLKVFANKGQNCSDSANALVKVFPGFAPNFSAKGVCLTKPIAFKDESTTVYGFVDSRKWDFGDLATRADTSDLIFPKWQYKDTGAKNVSLIVSNSKGCIDTVTKVITIIDTPIINLGFRDTLICVPDSVMLRASGIGEFKWSPAINMLNPNTATPTAFPTSTTQYMVELNDNDCINRATVQVRVVRFVTLAVNPDQAICLTDNVLLGANSDGLKFTWSPAESLNNPNILTPVATPTGNTLYKLTARTGSCSATDSILIKAVPYPMAHAGPDVTICYKANTTLSGRHNGSSFTWVPDDNLSDPKRLSPIVNGLKTINYILVAYDTLGCPKPGYDTVTVEVLPKINAFAGNDTLVIAGQPLQFNASGAEYYNWSPGSYLDKTDVANPVAIFPKDVDSITYNVLIGNELGCIERTRINVVVFKTEPTIFVPSAFTPNNDGLNDFLAPIPVGIKLLKEFTIYNRWGQRLFSTTRASKGWNGTLSGIAQPSGAYVWLLEATDFLNRPISKQGTSILIR